MMNGITLYAFPGRSRAERVSWTLDELKFDYKLIRLDLSKGEHLSADFLKLNPSGKVPVLVHDGEVYTESLAIMEYLNSISETKHLIPTSVKENYLFRNRLSYGLTEIESYLWIFDQASRLKTLYSWPEGTADDCMIQIRQNISCIDTWLMEHKYISGEDFSLADIYYYQIITWAQQYVIKFSEHTEEYLRTLESRQAFPEMLKNK